MKRQHCLRQTRHVTCHSKINKKKCIFFLPYPLTLFFFLLSSHLFIFFSIFQSNQPNAKETQNKKAKKIKIKNPSFFIIFCFYLSLSSSISASPLAFCFGVCVFRCVCFLFLLLVCKTDVEEIWGNHRR